NTREGTRTTNLPFSAPSWRVGRNHVEKLCGLTRRSMCCRIFSQEFMPSDPSKRAKKYPNIYVHRCGKAVEIHAQQTDLRLHSVSGMPHVPPLFPAFVFASRFPGGDASCRTELIKIRVDSHRTGAMQQGKTSRRHT